MLCDCLTRLAPNLKGSIFPIPRQILAPRFFEMMSTLRRSLRAPVYVCMCVWMDGSMDVIASKQLLASCTSLPSSQPAASSTIPPCISTALSLSLSSCAVASAAGQTNPCCRSVSPCWCGDAGLPRSLVLPPFSRLPFPSLPAAVAAAASTTTTTACASRSRGLPCGTCSTRRARSTCRPSDSACSPPSSRCTALAFHPTAPFADVFHLLFSSLSFTLRMYALCLTLLRRAPPPLAGMGSAKEG
jgi:hypothetical protein